MKILKKDYPFAVIIEDKIGKQSLKPYQSISVSFTEKNIHATGENDKYKTTYFNFFDEADLLALSSLCEAAYQQLIATRQKEREEAKNKPEPQTVGEYLEGNF